MHPCTVSETPTLMHVPLQAAAVAVAVVQVMTAPEVVAAGLAQGMPLY